MLPVNSPVGPSGLEAGWESRSTGFSGAPLGGDVVVAMCKG